MKKHYNILMRVLLIEDDEFNIEVTRDMLMLIADELGIELDIDIAKNGKEGVDMFDKNNGDYDIILTDMDMPIMKGDEVLDYIKGKDKDKKVLVLTAFGLQGDRERLLAKGFDGYIPKPIDYDTLKKELEKFV